MRATGVRWLALLVAAALLAPVPSRAEPGADAAGARELREAAWQGDAARVAEILDRGVPVDALESPNSRSALEAAACMGRLAVVELLLERGASLRRNEKLGIHAAECAAGEGHLEPLKALVARAALPRDPSADLCGAMGSAAASGEVEVLEYLLALGVGTDATCMHETPFERAAANARTEAALLLLARGAALRVSRSGAVVAASRAAGHGELPLVQAIVAAAAPLGGSPSDRFGEALSLAAANGNAPVARYLLELGVDVDWTPAGGDALPPAGRAAWGNGHDVVSILVAAGADPDASFLLDYAVSSGDPALVDELLAKGADPLREGHCGNPIARLSTWRGELTAGHLEAVDRLLARGADPNAFCQGKRALTWARENGHAGLAERLVAAGGKEGTTLGHKLLWLPRKLALAGFVAVMLLVGAH